MSAFSIANLRCNLFKPFVTAKLTNMSGLKSFSNGKNSGTYFNIELTDQSGSICGVSYDKEIFHGLKVGNVYEFRNLTVRMNRYKKLDILLSKKDDIISSAVEIVVERKVCGIGEIINASADTIVDVKASVADVEDIDGRRIVTLKDDENNAVQLTLWTDVDRIKAEHIGVAVEITKARTVNYNGQIQLCINWNSGITFVGAVLEGSSALLCPSGSGQLKGSDVEISEAVSTKNRKIKKEFSCLNSVAKKRFKK